MRGPQPAARLLKGAVLDLAAARDASGAWSTSRLDFTSDGINVSADRGGQAGRWRLTRADLLLSDWRGGANGEWRLREDTLRLTGAGDTLKPPAPLDQLLGGKPTLTATLRFVGDRIDLSDTRLEGPKLRLGAAGPIRNGALDLKVEAAARGPLKLGDADIAGAGTAHGALTGPANAWRLKARADLATLDIAGAKLDAPSFDLDLTPTSTGFAGPLRANARFAGQTATVTGALSSGGGVLRLSDFTATLAQARAKGDATVDDMGVRLTAALDGQFDGLGPALGGKIGGRLAIAPGSDNQPHVDLDLAVTEARFAGARASNGRITARGPFGAVRFDATARGGIDAAGPFALTIAGSANLSDTGQITARLDGDLDGRQIRSTKDAVLSWRPGGRSDAKGAFALGDGGADLEFTAAPDGFRARLGATQAPLAMLTGRASRLAGAISGQANIVGRGGAVSGDMDWRLDGVDLAGRRGDPVNATLKARLNNQQLALQVAARSGQGLALNLDGVIPVETSAAPLRIARAGAPARLNWSIAGPIDSVWRIVGPLGVVAGGAVDGKGALVLAAPGAIGPPISGDGAINISGGRLEDRASGVRLTQIDARAVLRDDGLLIERLAARDGENGKLTAKGRIGAAGQGELAIALDDFRLIKRPDVSARGDGDLKLAWTNQGARLTGAVDLIDADARQPLAQAQAPNPIAVIEVNRPVTDETRSAPKPAASLPVALDLKLTGARRLFTRARGLEAEWALDARVQGTAARPMLFGEARLLRGQSTLAGRPLTFERGLLRFDGPIEATQIDMRARIDAPNLTAALTLSGPLNNPELETTSTPMLPQDEILPQALFGVNAEQLSPLQAAQLAATLAVLSGRGAFDIANVARAAVNLDRLDLREEQGGLLLTGGKYITRDVYLEVSRGAQGQTTSALEWQVRPRLFLISSFEANGDPKLAVRWRRDY